MADKPRFGPAGIPQWFRDFKESTSELPRFLQKEGLNALEYEAVRWGQKPQIKMEDAERLGENAQKHDVWMSMHGSYYINLLSEKLTVEQSKKRLLACATAAKWMNAQTITFHLGYYTQKQSHKKDLHDCIKVLKDVAEAMQTMNVRANLGPETSGKLAQIGTLEEILTICENVPQTQPVVDWAHIHAIQKGSLRGASDFQQVIDTIEERLGTETVENLHCHFSHIEYTFRGERRHHPLDTPGFGPKFESLAKVIISNGLKPVIISETPLLDIDAKKMRQIYIKKLEAARMLR